MYKVILCWLQACLSQFITKRGVLDAPQVSMRISTGHLC